MIELVEEPTTAVIEIGTLQLTAGEIFDYVKNELVERAAPLKQASLDLHSDFTLLPGDWKLWSEEEYQLACGLYNKIAAHEKAAIGKGTDLDNFRDKAEKLKKGILRGLEDIMADCPADKDSLFKNCNAWRKEAERKAAAEAERIRRENERIAEEQRLAEALRLEEEAAKLKAANPVAAEELKQEAEAIVSEPAPYVPPPPVQSFKVAGGPKKQTTWKYEVVDFAKLPDMYKIANDKMLGATVRAQQGKTQIAGVRVFEG